MRQAAWAALAACALGMGTTCAAQTAGANPADVHVRVNQAVKTGIEGTVEFPTIQMALDHHPFPKAGSGGRVYIEIASGVYPERVVVTQNHPGIVLMGMGKGPEDVVITGNRTAGSAGGTFVSQTVEVNGADFAAVNLTIENTAGPGEPAVALALRSDRAVIKNCQILGYQHTLFADWGRQYFVGGLITGNIHFIFGNATAVFEGVEIRSVGRGVIASQSRTGPEQTTGYVFLRSRVTSVGAWAVGLGDPWRAYSRTFFVETELPEQVTPEGWGDRGAEENRKTVDYGEFGNTGPGANLAKRPAWIRRLSAEEAKRLEAREFLRGTDGWDPVKEAEGLGKRSREQGTGIRK
ncbi:MAG: pectinesterase family protein [Terracidiphilus sp.]|nr:pectinesterase family protein [Terracidiphilus sp.]